MSEALDWTGDGPRSLRYDDIYFSQADGLAETRAVFLEGCGLPQTWNGRTRFTVAELGFGTGLNIAALLKLWRRTRDQGARLSIFSIEAHPISVEAAARALGSWRKELGDAAGALLAAWPTGRQGFHRLDLPDFAATLDLYVGEVGDALARWSGHADAWFLDGFSPARNAQMWRKDVLDAVGRLSAPGARLASFTVAGHVRRGLVAAGFEVEKRPGFAAKRERLEARLIKPSGVAAGSPLRRVAVIGGGVAGAALVRAFGRQGVACTLVEASGPGAGASGNPAALVSPRFDVGFGPAAELHAQAFARAVDLYRSEVPAAIIAQGALQLAAGAHAAERFDRLAAWSGFAPGSLAALAPDALACKLDEPLGPEPSALDIADALVVEPTQVLKTWLAGTERVTGHAARLTYADAAWRVLDDAGTLLTEADAVCLAASVCTEALSGGLGLRPVRGQAEFTEADVFTGVAAAWGAYAIPLRRGGVLFGASHRRGDAGVDIRPAETAANLQALQTRRPALAERIAALAPEARCSRAGVRAATADHLPLAGPIGREGLYVLAGLGGRGFSLAPLLAEHIAALAVGAPSPISTDVGARLGADRFHGENRATV